MKTTKMLTTLIMALGLLVWSDPIVHGAQYLTVNGQDVTSITLELGQSRTVEVVSTDSASYVDYVGFDNGAVLGSFSHLETKPEAGNLAAFVEYDQPAFYGYYVNATGISPAPSPGVHFVFEYMAQEIGETDLKLYDSTFTTVIDSIHITVIPLESLPMATAFTYQGNLMDSNNPANGLYDFEFKLYDNPDPVFAAQQGNTIDINDLDVIDGYFTAELDFGCNVFNGDARWLEVDVRQADSNDPNDFIALSPRQELTPTPYALQTRGIFVNDSGNVGIGGTDPWYALDVYKAVSDSWVAGFHNLGTGDMDGGVIVRAFGGDPLLVQSATANVLNVKQNGNVGIGTTDPQQNLSVQATRPQIALAESGGDTGVVEFHEETNQLRLQYWSDYGTTYMRDIMVLDGNTGNIGIGTTDPQQNLSVQATRPQIALAESGGDTGVVEFHEDTNQLRLQYWSDHGATFMRDIMVLDGDTGRIGIGTTIPYSRLDIKAASGFSDGGLRITSSINDNQVITVQDAIPGDQGMISVKAGGSNKIVLKANGDTYFNGGNVGIGTTSPETDLHVDGTLKVFADSGVTAMHVENGTTNSPRIAIYGSTTANTSGFSTGVYGTSSSMTGDNYGVHGVAGTSSTGNNYGIYGFGVNTGAGEGYAGYFEGDVWVTEEISALTVIDRTPYPKDLATAYEAVLSMERLPDGQYDENNREIQLNHSMLSDFIRSKNGNRDLSATVSCHNEVLKDLIRKQQELSEAHIYIEQLHKQNKELETRLVKLESTIARLNVSQKGAIK